MIPGMMTPRAASVLLTLAGAALMISSCSDQDADRAAVVDRVRADPNMSGLPEKAVDCMADWYLEYATPAERAEFVAGRQPAAPPAGSPAEKAMLDCMKLATE
jgi:hypothetical protein